MGLISFFSRLQRSSIENPSTTLREAADWLLDAWGGGPSVSGVRVNRRTVLGYAAAWRAVNLISGDVAKLPLHVLRTTEDGQERDRNHPAYRLLRRKANEYLVSSDLKQIMTAHALLQGKGCAYIDRDGASRPKAVLLLNPEHVHVVRINGRVWFAYDAPVSKSDSSREMRMLPAEDVLHIKGLGYDGLTGYSVLELAKETFGMGIAARDYGSKFFSGGGRPSAVLEHPGQMKPEAAARLRDSWERQYSGLSNAHKTAILEEGMTLKAFGIPAKDAQLLESRQFEIREVANIFGVPPHLLGDPTRTSYGSLEQENQAYLDKCLDPWLHRWEEECWDKLLSPEEQDSESHTIEFLRQALVRANLKERGEYYAKATGGAPWMTINEIRRLESMNTLDTEEADDLVLPLNMRPVAESGAGAAGVGQGDGSAPAVASTPPTPEPESPERAARERVRSDAHRLMLHEAARRMAKRLGTQARGASGKVTSWREFMDSIEPKNRDTVIEAFVGPMMAISCDKVRARDDAVTAAALLFEQVRSRLAPVYASEPKSKFADAVERAVAAVEESFPLEIENRFGGPDAERPDAA